MKRVILVISILTLAAVVVSACGQKGTTTGEGRQGKLDGGSYQNITPAQLKSMLENKDFLFVNVHVPYEGEISGTDDFVPYNEIEPNLSRFPGDKGVKIVVYCRSGSMSAIAAKTLVKTGYTNIWNLDGGMIEWERQGFQLVRVAR